MIERLEVAGEQVVAVVVPRRPPWPRTWVGCAKPWPARTARRSWLEQPHRAARSSTALGADAPNAAGLVYIAASASTPSVNRFAPSSHKDRRPPRSAHLDIDKQGFAWLPEDDFVNHFAADVDPVKAKVMYAVQQPLAGSALEEIMGVPAWKSAPLWFLIADSDQAIPPDAERQFAKRMAATIVEVPTNHVAMGSHPDEVLFRIMTAATAVVA